MSMKKAMGLGTEKALSASPTHTVPGFGVKEKQMPNHLLTPSRANVIPHPILGCSLKKIGTPSHKLYGSYNLPRTLSQQSISGFIPGRDGE